MSFERVLVDIAADQQSIFEERSHFTASKPVRVERSVQRVERKKRWRRRDAISGLFNVLVVVTPFLLSAISSDAEGQPPEGGAQKGAQVVYCSHQVDAATNVNVRRYPSTGADVVASAKPRTPLVVLRGVKGATNPSEVWAEIMVGQSKAYIRADLIRPLTNSIVC